MDKKKIFYFEEEEVDKKKTQYSMGFHIIENVYLKFTNANQSN